MYVAGSFIQIQSCRGFNDPTTCGCNLRKIACSTILRSVSPALQVDFSFIGDRLRMSCDGTKYVENQWTTSSTFCCDKCSASPSSPFVSSASPRLATASSQCNEHCGRMTCVVKLPSPMDILSTTFPRVLVQKGAS